MPDPRKQYGGDGVGWMQNRQKTELFFNNFVFVLSRKMTIVTLSDPLIQKLTARDGRILRDRMLCGLCLKLGKRTRTFVIATSVSGRQFRMTLGRWPCISVDDARRLAMPILRDCRRGQLPAKLMRQKFPTLEEAIGHYCDAKRLKQSSRNRYLSMARTHFAPWCQRGVDELGSVAFTMHCESFARTAGAALVELARGLLGALVKYLNVAHGLSLGSPFVRLAAAGLLPDRVKPRAKRLQELDMPRWKSAVGTLPDKQRDYLMLIALTGMRRTECASIMPSHIDMERRVLLLPDTKAGRQHSLPITPVVKEILSRRLASVVNERSLFSGISAEHIAEMAVRAGAPSFMLHDLRKIFATTGQRGGVSDTVIRRILNHAPKRGDTLNRHYISLGSDDVRRPLEEIQQAILKLMEPDILEKGRNQRSA